MKIATWNINSVRLRRDLVKQFLDESDVDVLCLQETKTEDKNFPADFFAEAGWAHQAIREKKAIMVWRYYRARRLQISRI